LGTVPVAGRRQAGLTARSALETALRLVVRGEVRFDADPIFMATKDLREPFLPGFEDTTENYMKRVEDGSGETLIAGAAVPLLLGDSTWGVLGFIHFALRSWVPAEINALQAVASMLVQLQARIDAEERTAYNAYHDDLTDLPNRRALLRELTHRLGTRRDTAVLIIDLDRFKVMNDFLGHATGDRVLQEVARRLRASIRDADTCARLGGDDFGVLIDSGYSKGRALLFNFLCACIATYNIVAKQRLPLLPPKSCGTRLWSRAIEV